MENLIIYSEHDIYALRSIFKIFKSNGLKTDAVKVERGWDINKLYSLYKILNNYTHIFIILSSDNFDDSWVMGLIAYLEGSSKESYFYFTENDGSRGKLFSNFTCGEGYEDVEEYTKTEHLRWTKMEEREDARNYLIQNGFGLTIEAMKECVTLGQVDILHSYIEAGFSPSSRDSKGVPMLCLAVRSEYIDIVRYLIEEGAEINAVSEDRNNTPLMDAASHGFIEALHILIEEGAKLEYKSKNGQTALILAAGHGDEEVSNVLIKAGADYNVKDSLGMSAKMYATLFNKVEILKNME